MGVTQQEGVIMTREVGHTGCAGTAVRIRAVAGRWSLLLATVSAVAFGAPTPDGAAAEAPVAVGVIKGPGGPPDPGPGG
jgi:hypothetical protein